MANEATSEEYDSFDVGAFEFDPASIAHVDATGQAFLPHRNRHSGERSAATTQLATDVGSTVLKSHVPFLKSITFFDPKVYYHREVKEDDRSNNGDIPPLPNHDDDGMLGFADLSQWDIQLKDPIKNGDEKSGLLRQIGNRIGTKLKPSKIPKICVQDFNGLLELSSIQSGDSLVSVNKRAISPKDMNADEARDFMNVCIENDGVLNVVTESFTGNDTLIDITVIKPRPDMSYSDFGIEVWNWPYLCVREIYKGSIFEHTPLQETDQIACINDIDCSKMRAKEFATCVSELPEYITITVIRRKHRYTGSFN